MLLGGAAKSGGDSMLCYPHYREGWMELGFDDSSWSAPMAYGDNGDNIRVSNAYYNDM